MDEKKLEVMMMVVNGEKLEAKPYIRTTHPTQTRSKYFGEELQCSSIPQLKLISRLNPSITEGFRKDNKGFVYNKDTKSRTFSITLKCDEHKQQQEFQETEEFKQLSKERYKIEAKNSELKNVLGYGVSMGNCLYATKIQGACTIFAANIKRIITILDEK